MVEQLVNCQDVRGLLLQLSVYNYESLFPSLLLSRVIPQIFFNCLQKYLHFAFCFLTPHLWWLFENAA